MKGKYFLFLFHQDVQDSAVEDRVDPVAEEGHGRQKRVLKRLLIIFSRKNGFLIEKNSEKIQWKKNILLEKQFLR